jgi:DNA-binding response OmpR family regulator
MNILVIADEKERKKVGEALEGDFQLRFLDEEDLFKEKELNGDLAIISLPLKGRGGRGIKQVLRRLREGAPVLALLERSYRWDFSSPSPFEDFIYADFAPEELRARVFQLLHRFRLPASRNLLQVRDLVFDFDRYEVRLKGRPLELTFKEFELLRFLATHPGKVFTREVLLEQVWGYGYYGGSRTVDVHIRRIRSKIDTAEHTYIHTVRGAGYLFEP